MQTLPGAPTSAHALYVDNHVWLRGWLRRRLGNAADAADLAQDVFVRLLTRPKCFSSAPVARDYLKSMANGLCVDLWRRRELEQAWLDTLAARPDLSAPSPEHRALILEALMAIADMLTALPEKVATAFVLAQVDGLKYAEIATRLGVSERMVKKYMARAMLACARVEMSLSAP